MTYYETLIARLKDLDGVAYIGDLERALYCLPRNVVREILHTMKEHEFTLNPTATGFRSRCNCGIRLRSTRSANDKGYNLATCYAAGDYFRHLLSVVFEDRT